MRACTGKDEVSFLLVQMRAREASGIEGEAKKDIYIHIYDTNKYIFLYPLFLEKNRRFDKSKKLARTTSSSSLSSSYISLCLSSS